MKRFLHTNARTFLRLIGLFALVIWIFTLFTYTNTQESQQPTVAVSSGQIYKKEKNEKTVDAVDYARELFVQQQEQSRISLEDIRTIGSNTATGIATYDTQDLEDIYKKTQDIQVLQILVQTLSSQFRFEEAYAYLMEHIDVLEDTLDGNTIAYIVLNSSQVIYNDTKKIAHIHTFIEKLATKGRISKEDYTLYQGMLACLDGDIVAMKQFILLLQGTVHEEFAAAIINSINATVQQVDMPAYYTQALVALDLLRHGYFKIAQQIAITILDKNTSYILPYQILAYSHFVMNDRAIAADYIVALKQKDTHNVDTYNFLLGVCYFWQEKYVDAILFLSQQTNSIHKTDVLRYMALSYIHVGDTMHLMKTYRTLLGQDDIQPYDFYSFFEQVLFLPFALDEPYTAAHQYETIVALYLDQCYKKLSVQNQSICAYGKVGWDIFAGNIKNIGQDIVDLSTQFPVSYIFRAIGEHYLQNNNFPQAQKYFMKALSLTKDPVQKTSVKNKLFSIIEQK